MIHCAALVPWVAYTDPVTLGAWCFGAWCAPGFAETVGADDYFAACFGKSKLMANESKLINQIGNGATSGFAMCFAIGPHLLWCRGPLPKHVSNPPKEVTPNTFMIGVS